ncbi:MAG: carbohydrate-binding protein [Methylobacter sp.]|nr:carbohydrate-binding protein [Methylobacter sp.]
MRKTIINRPTEKISPGDLVFLDLEQLAQVEITSECREHPIESALVKDGGTGWQAAQPGEQTICIVFDQPLTINHIDLIFDEQEQSRTQEFVLLWLDNNMESYREILRQQFHFSPPNTTQEIEHYTVNLTQLKALKLTIVPNIEGNEAFAKLKQLKLA